MDEVSEPKENLLLYKYMYIYMRGGGGNLISAYSAPEVSFLILS